MDNGQKILLLLGSLLGFIGVAAGAFGAHALKHKLSSEMLSIFEVGARYQMYHVIAIFLSVWLSTALSNSLPLYGGWLFLFGTLIFAGSLYALALTGIKVLGAITPIGGTLLLGGWMCLIIAMIKTLRW